MAQRGRGVYFYTFFNLSDRWGWVVNATPGKAARVVYRCYKILRHVCSIQVVCNVLMQMVRNCHTRMLEIPWYLHFMNVTMSFHITSNG
jgi:hypothetical protein